MRRLITIPISHYCEKARWALGRAGLEYDEERHIQGVHQLVARRAGGGRTLPVLIADEGVYTESEDILRYADERVPPDRRLFPPDGEEDVVTLSRWLDAGLGPDGRRWIYARMMPLKPLLLRYNNQGVPRWEARALQLGWPLAKVFVSRELGVGPTTIADDEPRVRAAFDTIAERLADGRPYLCGDRFTAADLTFACLAAPVLAPPQYGTPLPGPDDVPEPLAGAVRSFRAHPAGEFALRMYRTERAPV